MARKHETRDQYVIIGTIQPQSNVLGNTPLNVTASIMLDGVSLNITVRRQGSVYLYSPAGITGGGGGSGDETALAAAPPQFVQLDGWHEASHFSWWSHDFTVEAELHTAFQPADAMGAATNMVKTEVPAWRVGDTSYDLTQARAFVSLGETGPSVASSFAYEVEPRPVSRSELTEVTTAF
jgi:hypothetical protein